MTELIKVFAEVFFLDTRKQLEMKKIREWWPRAFFEYLCLNFSFPNCDAVKCISYRISITLRNLKFCEWVLYFVNKFVFFFMILNQPLYGICNLFSSCTKLTWCFGLEFPLKTKTKKKRTTFLVLVKFDVCISYHHDANHIFIAFPTSLFWRFAIDISFFKYDDIWIAKQ